MDYIRRRYGVPAKRGARVKYFNTHGTITGSSNGRLRIKLDGEKHSFRFHPTWNIEYTETQ
jgi:hypothetical protein